VIDIVALYACGGRDRELREDRELRGDRADNKCSVA
jgi:hypothetical protein